MVGSCFGVHFFVRIFFWEGGFHVGKSSVVALVFGFGMDSCQTSVILNHCIKGGFLVCISCNVHVGGTELYLRNLQVKLLPLTRTLQLIQIKKPRLIQ